jgi:hypothetical protein
MALELDKTEKRMGAETVTLLKYVLEMELKKATVENGMDIALFMGVDGRIFSSFIPPQLTRDQYYLMNLVKANLEHLCRQLARENLKVSLQQYRAGTIVITGVGDSAFLAFLNAEGVDITSLDSAVRNIENVGQVIQHLFRQLPLTEDALAGYSEDVRAELKRLSRRLFVEKFEETRQYKRNMEILAYMKKEVAAVMGVGVAEEIVTVALNEIGTSPPYMGPDDWNRFVDKVVEDHLRPKSGEETAEKTARNWKAEVETRLKSFV